jgi:sulfite exporter TauE/SafE
MGALIGGIIVAAIGVWLWIIWPGQAIVLQGSIPIMLIAAGLLAIIAGITSIKDSIEAKKLEKEAQQQSNSSPSQQ